MSRTSDIINLIRDIVNPLGITVYKFGHPIELEGTERIVLNIIPNNQVRSGSTKQNNDLVNVNAFIPKLDGQVDSARIEVVDGLIQSAIESFNSQTTRVGYYYLNPQNSTVFNENDKENLINIRVEATYT